MSLPELELEGMLRDLGAHLDLPATPDVPSPAGPGPTAARMTRLSGEKEDIHWHRALEG